MTRPVADSVPEWCVEGARLMEHPGRPSQRCGTVIRFAPCNHSAELYPVVMWDSGAVSFTASDLIDVECLRDRQQLELPLAAYG